MSQALLEELAHAIGAKLAANADAAIVIDLPQMRVRVTEAGTTYEVFLGNAYREYVEAAPEARPEVVTRYALSVDRDGIVPPTAEDLQQVLPKLVPRRERALIQLRYGEVENLATGIPIADDLLLDLALDLPERIRMVSASDLAGAGLTEREAFDIAVRNLALRSREPWHVLAPGLYQSPWGDYFDGARLALPTLFTRLGVRGAPVVTIPNRCAVLVTGSEDPVGLRLLFEMTRVLVDKERALHPGGLRLVDGGRWEPLGAADADLFAQAPHLVFLRSLQAEIDHAAVGELVAEVIAAEGFHVEPLVATDHQGLRLTFTQLPRDAKRLAIPRADYVACNGSVFAWEALEAMLEKNLVALDVWPPHFEVRRMPTLVEIAHAAAR